MSIKYAIYPIPFDKNSQEWIARVISNGVIEEDDLIDYMVQSGTTVNRPDLIAAVELYHETIAKFLLEGMRIKTPTVNFGLSIRGKFNNPQDQFDAKRHTLLASLSAGPRLRHTLENRKKLRKDESLNTNPNPSSFIDFASDTRNNIITPDKPGQLIGYRLKLDPTDPQQGIFFINQADNTETKVSMIMHNLPSELMFVNPILLPGTYTIHVRNVGRQESYLLRGELQHTLTVSP